MKIDRRLDCLGFFCPMPIVKTKLEIDTMKTGEVLEVLSDDAGFEKDLPAWCKMSGEIFLEMKNENGVYKGYVKRK